MSGVRGKWTRVWIAGLYALAMTLVAFTASSNMHSVGASSHDAKVAAVASVSPSLICSSAGDNNGSAPECLSCCDACTLSAAPGLNVVATTHVIYVLEISARAEFTSRLGHVADATPDDLRSRAPPYLV
jgi:hypothetical protein